MAHQDPQPQLLDDSGDGSKPLTTHYDVHASLYHYFTEYLLAILQDWVSLLSGVGGVVLLVLLQVLADRYPSIKDNTKTFVWSAIVCLIIAGFSVWRKERQRVQRLDGSALLSITPKELVSEFNNKGTTADGDDWAKTYVGEWMKYSGSVRDIREPESLFRGQAINVFLEDSPEVILRFKRRWVRRIRRDLRKGNQVTVLGQIQKIDALRLSLHRCEVHEVGPRGRVK